MGVEYKFKSNKKIYDCHGKKIECYLSFYNLFVSSEDIQKLFSISKDYFNEQISVIYSKYLNEKEEHYLFVDWDNNSTNYYSLNTILSLSFIKSDCEDAHKFILWANRKLRSYLIRANYNGVVKEMDEDSFVLPKFLKEPKVCCTLSEEDGINSSKKVLSLLKK
jgi:hypothetical protein